MLIQTSIFERPFVIENAIETLKMFEPPEGYLLKFSGGKDSQAAEELCRMAGVRYEGRYDVTTVDPPELVQFIKKNYPHIHRARPSETMWQLIFKKGFLPTRDCRYCCDILKERSGDGRLVITGIRAQESRNRAGRSMIEQCRQNPNQRLLNIILDWTLEEVWNFNLRRGLEYCILYDEGFKRLG